VNWLKDFVLNRHEGQPSFGLHRLTGILLAVYLIPHIFLNGYALLYGAEKYDEATLMAQKLHWLELLIILGVAFHMFNGVRIIVVDFFAATRSRKALFWVASALTAITMIYSLWIYVPKMLGH
jgi:succinate dehydrogenase / fumarate reductase cytochrome b subunit